jgi:membrane associated rhomboid family serine protease
MRNYLTRQLWRSGSPPLLFVLLLWLIFALQHIFQLSLVKFGVLPRNINGLPGVITSVFIHGDIYHLASNSLPLLILGLMLFYFYRRIAVSCFLWIWITSGLWLWIGGRNSSVYPVWHIGASTLIYGLSTFLFFSGLFRRHNQLMIVSALVVFLYGSIMWGIFPLREEMSWEGHLFGALAGILVAYNYRKEGPQRRHYDWENEEEEPAPPGGSESEPGSFPRDTP